MKRLQFSCHWFRVRLTMERRRGPSKRPARTSTPTEVPLAALLIFLQSRGRTVTLGLYRGCGAVLQSFSGSGDLLAKPRPYPYIPDEVLPCNPLVADLVMSLRARVISTLQHNRNSFTFLHVSIGLLGRKDSPHSGTRRK